jgi:hypothetical protein
MNIKLNEKSNWNSSQQSYILTRAWNEKYWVHKKKLTGIVFVRFEVSTAVTMMIIISQKMIIIGIVFNGQWKRTLLLGIVAVVVVMTMMTVTTIMIDLCRNKHHTKNLWHSLSIFNAV